MHDHVTKAHKFVFHALKDDSLLTPSIKPPQLRIADRSFLAAHLDLDSYFLTSGNATDRYTVGDRDRLSSFVYAAVVRPTCELNEV